MKRSAIATVDIDLGEEADGRRRRSQDSRARIVAAMLELILEGCTSPNAEQVAARAKVGLRSVFRHFTDMESLYSQMAQVIETALRAVVVRPFKGSTWRDRVLEMVDRRTQAYEKVAPYIRASNIHRYGSTFLEAAHARLVKESREILKLQIPAEVAKDASKFEALDLLLSFEIWSRLRQEQGLTARLTREVLERAIKAVLDA